MPSKDEFRTLKHPLDFESLGLAKQEAKARKELQTDLKKRFEELSRDELSAPEAYVLFFPAFVAYVKPLVQAYIDRHPSAKPVSLVRDRLVRAFGEHIAPWRRSDDELWIETDRKTDEGVPVWEPLPLSRTLTRIDPETGEYDDEPEEDEYPTPQCLWEEVMDKLLYGPPSEVVPKRPENYEDSLVYVMRRGPLPRLYLEEELKPHISVPAKTAKKRESKGRPAISTELKLDALEARAAGKTRAQQARVLYKAKYVTESQGSSTTTLLRNLLSNKPLPPALIERCEKSEELRKFLTTNPWAQRALGGEKIPDPQ